MRGAALVLAVVLAAACSGGASPARPAAATSPSASAAPGAPDLDDATDHTCDSTSRALAPEGLPPSPNAMPAGSFMERIQRRGYLIAGVTRGTLGFGYLDSASGLPAGFDVDMAAQVSKAIFGDERHVEYRFLLVSERIPKLRSGEVDIVISTMTITCGRWSQVAFSSQYYADWQTVLVSSSSPASSLRDLHNPRVCATAGSTSIFFLRYRASGLPPMRPVAVSDFNDCLVGLQQGTVDAIATNEGILQGLRAEDPYTKIVGPRLVLEPHGFAISLCHKDFVRFVNGVLDRMRADGTWTRLYDRWLGPWLGPAPPPVADYGDRSPASGAPYACS